MFVPETFKESNPDVLHALIQSHPLATWVVLTDDGLEVNHIPFVLDCRSGQHGVLQGHVNRANTIWKKMHTDQNSVVVFQGPENYITPSWYASKIEHGKVVPTWNYVVVHAHGIPVVRNDPEWLMQQLNALTDEQENDREQPWKVSDAPKDYIDRMLRGIVGIEIEISSLEGAWKVSQNKQAEDRLGVIQGLIGQKDSDSNQMANHIAETGSAG